MEEDIARTDGKLTKGAKSDRDRGNWSIEAWHRDDHLFY